MKFLLGKKLEMTQKYSKDGKVIPVTMIHIDPCVVTQVKTPENDGYSSVQLGCGKEKKPSKPKKGHFKNLEPKKTLREFRVKETKDFEVGKVVDASIFKLGELVQVIGVSKGRGFAGVVKRHHFSGSPASHGHKDQLRMPGSIGSKRQGPVQRGKRMAGRMGGERVTVKNLEIIEVVPEKNLLAIKGAVPGARGALLLIQTI